MGADGGPNRPAEAPQRGEGGGDARVFRCTDYSLPRTTLALALWLGGIHFNVLLVLASLFLLSLRAAAMSVSPIHLLSITPKKRRRNLFLWWKIFLSDIFIHPARVNVRS